MGDGQGADESTGRFPCGGYSRRSSVDANLLVVLLQMLVSDSRDTELSLESAVLGGFQCSCGDAPRGCHCQATVCERVLLVCRPAFKSPLVRG